MKLSPGDQIQILLTVGGVPYAKTDKVGTDLDLDIEEQLRSAIWQGHQLMALLLDDIKLYGDEHEEEIEVR